MALSTRKGRPTPKAPQNRPRPKAEDTPTMKLAERVGGKVDERELALRRYRAYRRATRPFRRVFRGGLATRRQRERMARSARRVFLRDVERMYDYVDGPGVVAVDVAIVANVLGMRQGRVRTVLRAMGVPA